MYNIAVHTNVINDNLIGNSFFVDNVDNIVADDIVSDNLVGNNRDMYLCSVCSGFCIWSIIGVFILLILFFILYPFVRYSIPLR